MANFLIPSPQAEHRSAVMLEPAFDRYEADFDLVGRRSGFRFGSLAAVLLRERWLILAVLAGALLVGAAYVRFTPRMYRAEAVIQIDQQSPKVLGTEPQTDQSSSRGDVDRSLQTQVDLISSRAVAASVARDLSLDKDPQFLRASGLEDKRPPDVALQDEVLRAVESGLSVSSPKSSRLVSVYFDSRDPEVAAKVANGAVDSLIATILDRRLKTTEYSKKFLSKQINATKAKLEQSERALISYSRAVGFVDASGAAGSSAEGGGRSLTTANLVDLNSSYGQAKSARLQAEERWRQAQSTPLMSLPEVLANPAIQQLTRNRAELDAAFEEEKQRHKEGYPAMKQAAAKITEMDRQIGRMASSVRESLRDQYRVAARQEQALSSTLGQLKSATLSEQEKGVRYNILKREVDSNRDLFNSLLRRFNEISSQAGLNSNHISIVDRAYSPEEPVSPQPVVGMTLAGLGGLVLAFMLAYTRQRQRDAADSPDEIERELQVPVLGLVPVLPNPEIADSVENPRSLFNEAHYSIALSLDARELMGPGSVLVLTSSRQEEGKSTSALRMASNMALSGRRVLLVDGDMRRGSLHNMLGLNNDTGLANLLQFDVPLETLIQDTSTPNLKFLGAGRTSRSPAELLGREKLSKFIDQMRGAYDLIVIDGPPVLGLADAPRLAAAADGVIFVVEAHKARKTEAMHAIRRLVAAGANIAGVVMTKFDPAKAGSGYDYSYTYGYGEDRADADKEMYSAADDVGRGDGVSDMEQSERAAAGRGTASAAR